MFLALVSTILNSFSSIYWKRSLWFWVWLKMHDLIGYWVWMIVLIYFFIVGINIHSFDIFLLFSTFSILLINTISTWLSQKLYRQEKISAIIPYTNLNKVLAIILSFFIFSDVSFLSLLITILAIIIIIIFSIDFKKFIVPNSTSLIMLTEILTSINMVWSWYLILKYWEDIYFILFLILWILFLSILTFILWQYKSIKWLKRDFWINRIIWSSSWIARFLSMLVISELGLSITILLSFLWIWITLLFSYIILKDKPARKDLILTFIITALVWIGFYYK